MKNEAFLSEELAKGALLKKMGSAITITPLIEETIINNATIQYFKRKEFVLREGQICNFIFYIVSGLVRSYFVHEGEELTTQFFFENGLTSEYSGFLSNRPSEINLETLEPTQVVFLSKKTIYELYDKSHEMERYGRFAAEQAYLGIRQRTIMLNSLSPEERYQQIIKERPKVFERVPLRYIASFMGIQPESLSRIRRRAMEGGR